MLLDWTSQDKTFTFRLRCVTNALRDEGLYEWSVGANFSGLVTQANYRVPIQIPYVTLDPATDVDLRPGGGNNYVITEPLATGVNFYLVRDY